MNDEPRQESSAETQFVTNQVGICDMCGFVGALTVHFENGHTQYICIACNEKEEDDEEADS